MKKRYIFLLILPILFILILFTSFFTKKSANNVNKATKPRDVQNTLSNSPAPQQISMPTPTVSPLSAFTSSLNTLYSGPSNQNTKSYPVNPINLNNALKQNVNQTPTPTPDSMKSFVNALSILFSGFTTAHSVTTTITSPPQGEAPKQNNISSSAPIDKVYYPQCFGSYDNSLLPQGCTICDAGCGPTSVAMILSSYIDKKFDPPTVVNLYQQNGFEAGCKGTTIGDAQQILNQNGLKTTDIIYYGDSSFEETVRDMKNYLANGWTIYTLVKFGPKWGHFYWVINVDQNNNVWAYDPGDGRRPVPLNENNVEPSPRYYVAFGVKKS